MGIVSLSDQCVCIRTPELCKQNMDASLARGYPVVAKREPNNRSLAIVGGGPSLTDDVERIREFPGDIWTVNGSLDFLTFHGVRSDGFVMIDPHPLMVAFLQDPPKDTIYYMASSCDPAVFDLLNDRRVEIWHPGAQAFRPPKGQGMVGGGPTVLTRAPMLAFCLGYRDVHLFGADSSYENGMSHAVQAAQNEEDIRVELDGTIYETSPVYVHQVAYFVQIHWFYKERGANFEIHGRGLGPAILKAKVHQPEEFAA